MSSLLFYTADVLNKCLSQLVSNSKIRLIKASKQMAVPSHILNAYKIMIFSRGCTSSIDVIVDLFIKYVSFSGQVTNPSKSILYDGSMSSFRQSILADMIDLQQFLKANLKEIMLGMQIIIPADLAQFFPTMPHLASKVFFNNQEDSRIWMRSDNSALTFKDAYSFLNGNVPTCDWGWMI
ncbi:hypothetical protein KIW84_075207 [Lathyrus oleraceus]|uniref:Uncharacterized protein n=1 Tax=Pisum sativum TaxID=3888 RepID=A0A9D4ZXS9_PEA|nr:hypothetical protein KIW84_075207 [Pisum sativum]